MKIWKKVVNSRVAKSIFAAVVVMTLTCSLTASGNANGTQEAAKVPAVTSTQAMDYLAANAKVQGLLKQGMSMLSTDDQERIGDYMCRVVKVGTNHPENFVTEYIFAVAPSGEIHLYDVVSDKWEKY